MIRRLDEKTYKGKVLPFEYVTEAYYDTKVTETHERFNIEWIRTKFDKPIKKSFTDELYPDYLEAAEAYGYFVDDTLIGVFEVNEEKWANRLRISELNILDKSYRRKGLGKQLMDYIKDIAKDKKVRMIILETQTCNTPAIDFYRSQGFNIIGADMACYTNKDIDNKEVRLELGYKLD